MQKTESGDDTQGHVLAKDDVRAGSDTQTSFDAEAFASALEKNPALQKAFDDAVARRLQSEKDRRISKAERRLDDFDERLGRYEKYRSEGMAPENAKKALELDDALEYFREQKQSTATSVVNAGTVKPQAASADVSALLETAGLSVDDPDVVKLLRETPQDSMAVEAAKLVVRKVTGKQVSPGQVILGGGGNVPATSLREQYEAESANIPRGSHQLLELRHKYRKLGLNI